MKQFRNKTIILLFYEIAGWCFANKQLPRSLNIWVDDKTNEFVCNCNHYLDREPIQNVVKENLKQPEKVIENKTVTIDEVNEHSKHLDELTQCERNNANYLMTQGTIPLENIESARIKRLRAFTLRDDDFDELEAMVRIKSTENPDWGADE